MLFQKNVPGGFKLFAQGTVGNDSAGVKLHFHFLILHVYVFDFTFFRILRCNLPDKDILVYR